MKRLLSFLLALVLCFSLSATVAFATGDVEPPGEDPSSGETTGEDPTSGGDTPEEHGSEEPNPPEGDSGSEEPEPPEHTHTWSTGWNSDANDHWHKCSVCEYVERAAHTWDSGTVKTAATCTKDGTTEYKCTVCGATKTVIVKALGHDFSGSWLTDSHNHWRKCLREGCTEIKDETSHSYGSTWEKDADKHWQVCTVCGYKATSAAHTWNSGTVTKQATCVAAGVKTYTCTVCGATKTETIPVTSHSWDGGTTTVKPTVTEKGESVFKCTICGKTTTREIEPLGKSMSQEELLTLCAETGNYLDANIDDEKWVVLQGMTTEEEYARISNGWPITITLDANDVTRSIGSEIKETVQKNAGKQKIYGFIELLLTKELLDDSATPVTELSEPVIVSFALPERLLEVSSRRKERAFSVYRVDADHAKKVAAKLSEDGERLQVQIDAPGTYALLYHDKSTGNFSPILLLYIALGLVTLGGMGFFVYKLFFSGGKDEYDEYDDEYDEEYDDDEYDDDEYEEETLDEDEELNDEDYDDYEDEELSDEDEEALDEDEELSDELFGDYDE